MALCKSLLGNSSQWLSQICFAGMSWLEFKDLFLHRYEGIKPPSAVLLNILNGRPNANESLSVYGSRLVTSLLTKWKRMSQEEIAVSLVLAITSQTDPRLQSSVFTTNIKTRNELQQLLKAFAFSKVSDNSGLDQGPDRKRFKEQAQIKCHYCGKMGHKAFECRKKKGEERNDAKPIHHTGKPFTGRERSGVTCFKWGNPVHIASACAKGTTSTHNYNNEKRVDMCAVLEPTGIMKQMGESFIFFFDSGAECSLVKEKLCNKLAGKRIYNTVVLRGIGDNIVKSNLQILATVNISEFNVEVLFHVVMDNYLKYDIIIGREILQLGFGVMIDVNVVSNEDRRSQLSRVQSLY